MATTDAHRYHVVAHAATGGVRYSSAGDALLNKPLKTTQLPYREHTKAGSTGTVHTYVCVPVGAVHGPYVCM